MKAQLQLFFNPERRYVHVQLAVLPRWVGVGAQLQVPITLEK